MKELKNILLNLKEKKYNALQLANIFKKLEKTRKNYLQTKKLVIYY